MDTLNEWEQDMIKVIDDLLLKARLRYCAFERQHMVLNSDDLKKTSQRLRYLLIDLYSVLDYLCYLCYCHYKNNGQPDYSEEAKNVKFPYASTLKESKFNGQKKSLEGQQDKFVRGVYSIFFGPINEQTQNHFDNFKEFILSRQRITEVDGAGIKLAEYNWPAGVCQIRDPDRFYILHFLRNYSAHRDLVRPIVKNAWLNINRNTGRYEINDESRTTDENNPVWQSIKVHPGWWVLVNPSQMLMPLLTVAEQLTDFVITTRNELIRMAFSSENQLDFDANRARWGYLDGVRIDGDQHYDWKYFDYICNNHGNNFDVWAV